MDVDPSDPGPGAVDHAWFSEQVEQLLPELFGSARRLCGDPMEAEDLVAEALAKSWASLGTLSDRDAFRGWIYRILNNTFISSRRSARSRVVHEPLDSETDSSFSLFERLHQPVLLWWGNPEQDFLNRLLRSDLECAIDGLPGVFREVVVMVDVQGLAYREAAGTLGVPVGTVRSRLARGHGLLQEALWRHALDAGVTNAPAPAQGNDES